jgi:hypothetical protein
VFLKRVLERIYENNSKEITEGWSKVNNEKLHNFYSTTKLL